LLEGWVLVDRETTSVVTQSDLHATSINTLACIRQGGQSQNTFMISILP
jgi:hypothetical protein